MGGQRPLAGHFIVVVLAIMALLGLLPWQTAASLIIAIAIFASMPSGRRLAERTETTLATRFLQPASPEKASAEEKQPERIESRPEKKSKPASPPTHAFQPPTVSKPSPPRWNVTSSIKDPNEKIWTQEGPQTISAGDYLSFKISIKEGEELVADVSAEGDLNVYVMTEENLTALDSDDEYWYEVGTEGVRSTTLKFAPEEDGTWFLVVDNGEEREVSATIKFNVRKAPHDTPLLKSDKLGLKDEKLESKLGT